MKDLALATCMHLPEPDPDAAPLLEALAAAGIDASFLAWDDPASDWSQAKMTLLRSTWNYPLHADDFLDWAERTAAVSELWNPLDVVRWNVHKGYLLELVALEIEAAPTELVRCGDTTSLRSILDRRGWKRAVVKPAISAASYKTMRVDPGDLEAGEAHLRELAAERDVLVQGYLPSVEDYGERALVWVEGKLTHAVRKSPRLSGDDESVSDAVPIRPEEADLAYRAIAALGWPLLYARIDVAPDAYGNPMVMELELIEPSLFFAQGPEALERLVAGIATRLGR